MSVKTQESNVFSAPKSRSATVNHHVTRGQVKAFLILWGLFSILTFLIANGGIDDGPKHARRVLQTTLGTISGPMTGAIARDFQRCCAGFSFYLLAFCAPALALGLLAQVFSKSPSKLARITRNALWFLGWLVWFGGGIVSFAHALS